MAVVQRDKADKVIIQVDVGTGAESDLRNRTISKITPTLTDAIAYEVGNRLATMQANTVEHIKRSTTYTLVNET